MSEEAKLMCGIIVLTIPTVQYGGYFLLTVISGKFTRTEFTGFQQSMFRAGHAHAGVLIILSLVCQLLADHTILPPTLTWFVRIGVPLAAILMSAGFFVSSSVKGATKPNQWIKLLYIGVTVLALSMIVLGIGLLNQRS